MLLDIIIIASKIAKIVGAFFFKDIIPTVINEKIMMGRIKLRHSLNIILKV